MLLGNCLFTGVTLLLCLHGGGAMEQGRPRGEVNPAGSTYQGDMETIKH